MAGSNVRNEPNFRRPRYPTIPVFHCSSVPIRCLSCKTKPIWECVGRRRQTLDQVDGRLYQESIAQNKAKLGQDGISGGRVREANGAKRSQFVGGQRLPRAGMAANVADGTYRAKRSQFAPYRPREPPADAAQVPPPRGRSVQNEANFRPPGRRLVPATPGRWRSGAPLTGGRRTAIRGPVDRNEPVRNAVHG